MRPIYTLLLCLISFTLSGQNKIEGIGKFKVGKTTIADLSTEPIKKIKESYEAAGMGQEFVELMKNDEDPESTPERTPYSESLRVFYVSSYEVAGVELIDFYLTFYNNVLFKINCNPSDELTEALTLKYGKPKVDWVAKPVKCVYRMTGRATAPKNNQTKSLTWINGRVTALNYYRIIYDSNCEAGYYSFFHIVDTTKSAEVIVIEKAAKVKDSLDSKNAKRKALSDF